MESGTEVGFLELMGIKRKLLQDLLSLIRSEQLTLGDKATFMALTGLVFDNTSIVLKEFAREMEVTPNAVVRWKLGRSAPANGMVRRIAVQLFERAVVTELELIEDKKNRGTAR